MAALMLIIYVLILIIFGLAVFAVMQIRMAGLTVKDFWTFIEANQELDKLDKIAKNYEKMSLQQQVIFLKEAEKVFSAFDKVPASIWEEESNKYSNVLDAYKDIKVMRWIANDKSNIKEEVTDTNAPTARTTRNQFVWVPVANPSEMYGTDSSGKKWGKLYNFSSDGITARNWTEQEGIMTITSATSYREPDAVDSDSSNSLTKGQLEQEFNSMIASVEKYGGFYIGRYETGNLSQAEAVVVKNNSDINNQTWYTMYNKA